MHQRNFNLWNWDVFEIFLQSRDQRDLKSPYLEFEISPLGQILQLQIIEPRKIISTPLFCLLNIEKNIVTPQTWSGQFSFTSSIFLDNKNIWGGFFACLGVGNDREFFSLNPNTEANADFHRPELFLPLEKLCH